MSREPEEYVYVPADQASHKAIELCGIVASTIMLWSFYLLRLTAACAIWTLARFAEGVLVLERASGGSRTELSSAIMHLEAPDARKRLTSR